ncbi:MAG: ClpXP protease specificity-enhancing factor SspB [Pseudomonadota bacterium]
MTAAGTIDYDALTQTALRQVVRDVLRQAEAYGLPGEHHFYISFDTKADGVVLSDRLRGKYPEEMTIVLQHRFWDLAVSDERFEVKLTFDGVPERLVVPFEAIRVFFDPSVRYAIQFASGEATTSSDHMPPPDLTPAGAPQGPVGTLAPVPSNPIAAVSPSLRAVADDETSNVTDDVAVDEDADDAALTEQEAVHDSTADASTEDDDDAPDSDGDDTAGVVINLDSFRKK